MFSSLIVEMSIIKGTMNWKSILILRKADLFYIIFSGLTICTGLLRMYNYGKGEDYYLSNSLFILKFSLFILVGLLSIYPSVSFFRIKKSKNGLVKIKHFISIKTMILIEMILLLFIPLLGVLVAKGIS